MKLLLAAVLLLCATAQAAIFNNTFTTNSAGKTPNILATSTNVLYPLMVLNPDGSGTPRDILFNSAMTVTGTNTTLGGNLSLNGRTNRLSISAGGVLLLDGAPIVDTVWTNDAGVIRPVTIPSTGDFNIIGDQVAGNPATLEINFEAWANLNGGSTTNNAGVNINARSVVGSPSGTILIFANDPTGDHLDTIEMSADPPGDAYITMFSTDTNSFRADIAGILSSGTLRLQSRTNRIGDNGTSLTFNGVPIGGTTNIFNVAKGGHLTVSNSFTIMTNATISFSNLPLPAVLVVLTNSVVTNATLVGITQSADGQTLTASGGDTTATNIVTLTQTGTNVSELDYSLVRGGGAFKLQLTSTGYIGAPSGVASTPFSKAWLIVQQPSTGGCFLTFTNEFYNWPEGVAPIINTQNSAVTVYQFISDPITNGMLHGWMSVESRNVPR